MVYLNRIIISRKSRSSATLARLFIIAALVLSASGCEGIGGRADQGIRPPTPISTGADELVKSGFEALHGMNIGLIVNHTARTGGRHLIDVIHEAQNVKVHALFGPEHGIRGDEGAGAQIDDGLDNVTGAPVYSLYGEVRRPTPEMLNEVDALVFDIQDVGARFYTFISTMGLSMQSAALAEIPFIVLDRPNPLGGERVEGFIRDSSLVSFVSQYPIPVRHGLTVGELARMIKGEAWLDDLENLDLRVIEMSGWNRDMMWPDTGLEWIPTSPNIPTFETALVYAGTCFFEATIVSEGRGTPSPFLTLGAPWLDAESLAEDFNRWDFPGVRVSAGTATPVSIPGAATHPKLENIPIQTLTIEVTNPDSIQSVALGLDLVGRFFAQAPDSLKDSFFNERWLGLLSGSAGTLDMIRGGMDYAAFEWKWRDETAAFQDLRRPYLLY